MSLLLNIGIFREEFKLLVRDPKWSSVRKEFLITHCECAACSKISKLQVHHILPVHMYSELELDFNNLITLCAKCHFVVGHGGNWKKWNENVVETCINLQRGIRSKTNNENEMKLYKGDITLGGCWQQEENDILASCPVCNTIRSLKDHTINDYGRVTPSFRCPKTYCPFNEFVILLNWKTK